MKIEHNKRRGGPQVRGSWVNWDDKERGIGIIIALAMLVLATIFVFWYWHRLRPDEVRQACHSKAFKQQVDSLAREKQPVEYETLYRDCLQSRGIEQ